MMHTIEDLSGDVVHTTHSLKLIEVIALAKKKYLGVCYNLAVITAEGEVLAKVTPEATLIGSREISEYFNATV